ncbi:hypothetical protein GP486_005865 [Trichoglossum hirsutum]|uniref:NACHT domain-containing protein n=1 Tax=Trichoglossum hirsutum TaxID=265104 RepID=A0A9P8L8I8_9PEZI|nr:hypothetical protein GP486_005865 [Trichoglossum hirsutum]
MGLRMLTLRRYTAFAEVHERLGATIPKMIRPSGPKNGYRTSPDLETMGGLIVKKPEIHETDPWRRFIQAYLLAKSDPLYLGVALRTHSLYFIGTPHRGANSTVYLETFLSLNPLSSAKAYVSELLPGSRTVREINTEFRNVCGDVHLWSFFEGVTTAGVFVVDKSSAILDLPREHIQYLPADHRRLCKFATPDDPTYTILYQCFLTTVSDIENLGKIHSFTMFSVPNLTNSDISQREAEYRAEMKLISKALDVVEHPRRDLAVLSSKLHQGSCQWLIESEHFQEWLSFGDGHEVRPLELTPERKPSRFLWLSGPPGSGKSVAAGRVIQFLEEHNLDCSYFFFKSNTVAALTRLLLTLAFQMAESSYEARYTCLAMIEKGIVNIEDHPVIWNNLFLGRLFKIPFSQPHFWVIDALDECTSRSLSALIQMFAKMDPAVPLRVFITSRPNIPVELRFREEGITLSELQTGQSESMKDITAYVESRFKLRLDDDDQRNELMSDIVRKSRGIFLWASLIIDRLEKIYSVEDMKNILHQIPSEMIGMYTRILDNIKTSPASPLAKCILEWVVCAPTPLKAEELRKAIQLDIHQTLIARSTASNDIFSEICGNLITVDPEGHVQLMHQTVKEFLTSMDSGLYINSRPVHESHAATCLNHLNGRKFASGPSRRIAPAPNRVDDAAFDEYACANFSYHLLHSHSTSVGLFNLLGAFMNGGILTWIERVAETGKLGPILTVVQNLKPYLAQQLERSPPFDVQYKKVRGWLDDLTRLVTIFGPNLIDSPSSIYLLIPPLCPTSSAIHKTFAKRSRHRVVCDFNEHWDERLSNLFFPSGAKAIASSDQYLAIGLADGTIRVFNESTLENVTTLNHGKPLRQLAFGNISNALSSCSHYTLILWSSKFTQIWSVSVTGAFSICFSPDDTIVYVAVRGDADRTITAFRTDDGSKLESFSTVGYSSDLDSDGNTGGPRRYIPEVVRLSPLLGLAAVAYRSTPVTLFSFGEKGSLKKIATFKKKGSEHLPRPPQVLDVAFSPSVESDLMAVSYQDGNIVTVEIDTWGMMEKSVYKLFAYVLASSPDGRTLAAGDNEGGVCLFVFDTLQLLYRISAVEEIVTRIVFASNSLRVFDIRGRSCNAWEPPVLVRKNAIDDASTDSAEQEEPPTAVPDIFITRPFEFTKAITVMTSAGNDDFIICGREDGSMSVHDLKKGDIVLSVQLHSAGIRHLAWDSHLGVLLSVDYSGRWLAKRFSFPPSGPWAMRDTITDGKTSGPVIQTLIKPGSNPLTALISTPNGEELVLNSNVIASNYSVGACRWMPHPTDPDRLLLLEGRKVQIFSWDSLKRESEASGISVILPAKLSDRPLSNEWQSQPGLSTLTQTYFVQKDLKTEFITLDASHIHPFAKEVIATCTTRILHMKRILKIQRSNVFFLSRNGWICSLSMRDVYDQACRYYTRHFFIPPYWRMAEESVIEVVRERDSVALAYGDGLILFSAFLDGGKKVYFPEEAEHKSGIEGELLHDNVVVQ